MDYSNIIRRKKEREEQDKQEYDRNKLLNIVAKKMTTISVGSLATVEKHLGFLWGHKEYRELTDEEKFIKEKWDICRKEILDRGNKQIRNTDEEFKLYTITCNGYQLNLPVYRNKEGQNG